MTLKETISGQCNNYMHTTVSRTIYAQFIDVTDRQINYVDHDDNVAPAGPPAHCQQPGVRWAQTD